MIECRLGMTFTCRHRLWQLIMMRCGAHRDAGNSRLTSIVWGGQLQPRILYRAPFPRRKQCLWLALCSYASLGAGPGLVVACVRTPDLTCGPGGREAMRRHKVANLRCRGVTW